MAKARGKAAAATAEVKAVDFAELQSKPKTLGATQLKQLADLKFEAEAVLGRTVLTVGEILNLGAGSVIELNRQVSEPVDLIVQGVRVATAEVVVVDDSFALRIKEIIKLGK